MERRHGGITNNKEEEGKGMEEGEKGEEKGIKEEEEEEEGVVVKNCMSMCVCVSISFILPY